MPHANTRQHLLAVTPVVVLLLACLGLAACGGSSSSTTSSSANAASTGAASGTSSTGAAPGTSSTGSTGTTSTSSGAPGAGRVSGRVGAMRECLQKNGIAFPTRAPGARPGGGIIPGTAGAGGGRSPLPGGVTRAQYEAALKKCGADNGHFFNGGEARRLNNPVFRAALGKYAACLRQNGIGVPTPNTSGNGPIFNTKGISTTSPKFVNAAKKCRSALVGAFRRPGGTPGVGGSPSAGPGAPASGGASGSEG